MYLPHQRLQQVVLMWELVLFHVFYRVLRVPTTMSQSYQAMLYGLLLRVRFEWEPLSANLELSALAE